MKLGRLEIGIDFVIVGVLTTLGLNISNAIIGVGIGLILTHFIFKEDSGSQ